ncbi:MAG TPA: RNA polymerase II-associated protein [Desulfobacteraceae bacterium]|nr:RNA polymerase II-associated protein [Desulfobacteraceae bacterium]HDL98751.1 RNA polymerase II-associated protein [Desulfobacteraceae bacterium]HDO31077.1 RNA polymerase II-associated protein [Desulfobacteraceae bacterium]
MNMELECAKYKEKMSSGEAYCHHPGDYCKFRTSCIIHFMGSENGKKDVAKSTATAAPADRQTTGSES